MSQNMRFLVGLLLGFVVILVMVGTFLFLTEPVAAQRIFVSTVVIGMSTRQANTYTFSSVPIPLGVKGLEVTMDLSEAPDPPSALPDIAATLDCSLDGGANWVAGGGGAFTRTAGPKTLNRLRTGLQQTTGAAFVGGDCWNAVQNPNRRLRGSAFIGGTLRFALTVQPL